MSGIIREIDVLDLSFANELLRSGYDIIINVRGSSMYPFLRNLRDRAVISCCSRDEVKKGDVVLYRRTNGKYVLHRVVKKDNIEGIYLSGDAQWVIEGPVNEICGKVKAVYRDHKCIKTSGASWKILSFVWVGIFPARRLVFILLKRMSKLL